MGLFSSLFGTKPRALVKRVEPAPPTRPAMRSSSVRSANGSWSNPRLAQEQVDLNAGVLVNHLNPMSPFNRLHEIQEPSAETRVDCSRDWSPSTESSYGGCGDGSSGSTPVSD